MRALSTTTMAVVLAFAIGTACGALLAPRTPCPAYTPTAIATINTPATWHAQTPPTIAGPRTPPATLLAYLRQVQPTPTETPVFSQPSPAMRMQIARDAWRNVARPLPAFDEIATDRLFKGAYTFNLGAPCTPIFASRIGEELWWGQGYSQMIVAWREGDPDGYLAYCEWSGGWPGVYIR
jgi:hypothetical protein